MEHTRLVQFGAAIRSLRTALAVSQQQLARRIGRSQAFVSLVERGRYRSLTVADGDRLCQALGGTLVLGSRLRWFSAADVNAMPLTPRVSDMWPGA